MAVVRGLLADLVPPGMRLRIEIERSTSGNCEESIAESGARRAPDAGAGGGTACTVAADQESVRDSLDLAVGRREWESDVEYVQRLAANDPDCALLTRDWATMLESVSRRMLDRAKHAGVLAYERLGETRGGNGHVVSVAEIQRLLETIESVIEHGRTPPPWYAAVCAPTHEARRHRAA